MQDSSRVTALRLTSAETGRTDNALRSGVEFQAQNCFISLQKIATMDNQQSNQ